MKINFNIWFIDRDDDGFIKKSGVSFYEGNFEDATEFDAGGSPKTVNKYIINRKLGKADLTHQKKWVNRINSGESAIFDVSDFGQIKTEEEMRTFLAGELTKDKTRESLII